MSKGRAEAVAGGKGRGRRETWEKGGQGSVEGTPPRLVSLRSLRDPAEVPTGAEPALQRPGRVREPAAGTRTGQGGEDPLLGFLPWDPLNQPGFLPSRGCHSSLGLPKALRALPASLVTFPSPARSHSPDFSAPSPLPGGGEGAGPAGPTRQDQREDVRQAENILC